MQRQQNKMKYKLNKKLSYYTIENEKTIISSFNKDDIISCKISSAIINLISRTPLTFDNIVEGLDFPPALILRKINSLKNSNIIVSNSNSNQNKPNRSMLMVGQSYFDELVFFDDKSSLKHIICSDGETLLYINLSQVCVECTISRVLSHRPLLAMVRKKRDAVKYIPAEKIEVKAMPLLEQESTLVEHCLITNTKTSHKIRHIPSCKHAIIPEPQHLSFQFDTSNNSPYRSKSSQSTLTVLMPLVSKYTGVISKLEPYGSSESLHIHNYVAGKNTAFSLDNISWVKAGLRSANGGKGKTKLQAQCSAVCEAIERYSMVHHGRSIGKYTKASNLDHRFIQPNSVLNYSNNQFDSESKEVRESKAPQHWIPKKFDINKDYYWVEAFSVTQSEPVYIPAEIAFSQLDKINDEDRIAMPDSNGCAAGNTFLEAIFQGSLELIERDAVAIWWYNKVKRNEIDLKSIKSSYINNIVAEFASLNRTIYIIDITTDISIPTFSAISYNKLTRKQILFGFGCHTNPTTAAERAISEVCQLLPALTNPQTKKSEPLFHQWLEEQSIDNHDFLNNQCLDCLQSTYDIEEESIEKHFSDIVTKLKNVNQDLIIFDLTTSDTNFPVAKVISPGLRHFWRRTSNGRLYDVPARMGWKSTKLKEHELNEFDIVI
ncbi:YcaO-like family protein [Pseudoalteromonas sp. MMG013]|uniref:YcaO-like family protein n=1 Tax=Pseudoalteromonas sp. MMG013 TaxID=2822687 RepID=UPI001B39BB3C|nr:YcaO-like family protein [Pseudoalteromonas sp. MMG013]MBQ4860697.1 YcaO-like family protein [Pseudoalteromonas sp. MMG013]